MCLLQEAVKESKAALLTPEDGDEVSFVSIYFKNDNILFNTTGTEDSPSFA